MLNNYVIMLNNLADTHGYLEQKTQHDAVRDVLLLCGNTNDPIYQ